MMFRWETRKEKIIKGTKVSAAKKLEGIRLMNELTDRVLSTRQKLMRRKLKENS